MHTHTFAVKVLAGKCAASDQFSRFRATSVHLNGPIVCTCSCMPVHILYVYTLSSRSASLRLSAPFDCLANDVGQRHDNDYDTDADADAQSDRQPKTNGRLMRRRRQRFREFVAAVLRMPKIHDRNQSRINCPPTGTLLD